MSFPSASHEPQPEIPRPKILSRIPIFPCPSKENQEQQHQELISERDYNAEQLKRMGKAVIENEEGEMAEVEDIDALGEVVSLGFRAEGEVVRDEGSGAGGV